MSKDFVVPKWSSKPPAGLHLDVYKDDQLIQKLMVDDKRCYFFGRNRDLNDICIDHSSCSRVHAVLLYHEQVKRSYLIDLGSVHGTFVGNLRLEPHKPTPLPIDSTFSFGASTRRWMIRDRPAVEEKSEETDHSLPESEVDLDNLTKFNTARNRRLEMLGMVLDETKKTAPKRKMRKGVSFNDEEDIINPEDVDPSVGRFRNLVKSALIPSKRIRLEAGPATTSETVEEESCGTQGTVAAFTPTGFAVPNPAPNVDEELNQLSLDSPEVKEETEAPKKKKKYVKESWPGKRSLQDAFDMME